MSSNLDGWTFTDANDLDWQPLGDKIAMKMLGAADGKIMAMFQLDAGYVGGSHHHDEPEFTHVLSGSIISNGVTMEAGHSYAATAGTTHEEFRSDHGCTLISVFKAPS